MKSLLIKDTTISERAQIVREALGAESDCEGIDLSDMYMIIFTVLRKLRKST